MNQIFEIMEFTGESYIKKLIYFYIGFIGITIFFSSSMDFYIGSFILLWIHTKRFKSVLGNGSYNRIRLLPIKKTTFMYSELLYVGATYAMLLACIYIVALIKIIIVNGGLDISANQLFFYILQGLAINLDWAPITFLNIIKLMLLLIWITYMVVMFLVTLTDKDKNMSVLISFLVIMIVVVMLTYFSKVSIEQFSYETRILCQIGIMIPIIVGIHHFLKKSLFVKEVTSK